MLLNEIFPDSDEKNKMMCSQNRFHPLTPV